MQSSRLFRMIQILFLFFLVFTGLYFAKPFLVPFIIAGLLAMVFLPFSNWLEKKGVSRGVSSLLSLLALLCIIAGLIALLSWQISDLSKDMSGMQENVTKQITKLKLGIS